jgi:hypothetical protein
VLVGVCVKVGDGVILGSIVKSGVGVIVGNINTAPSHDTRRDEIIKIIVILMYEVLIMDLSFWPPAKIKIPRN